MRSSTERAVGRSFLLPSCRRSKKDRSERTSEGGFGQSHADECTLTTSNGTPLSSGMARRECSSCAADGIESSWGRPTSKREHESAAMCTHADDAGPSHTTRRNKRREAASHTVDSHLLRRRHSCRNGTSGSADVAAPDPDGNEPAGSHDGLHASAVTLPHVSEFWLAGDIL